MKDVLDGLSDIDAANVVRCARVLLRRPLLRADGPDGDLLPLVYRHRTTLQDLFAGLHAGAGDVVEGDRGGFHQ